MNPEIFGRNGAGAQDAIPRFGASGHSDVAAADAETTIKHMIINNDAILLIGFLSP